MSETCDVNVLVYASDELSPEYERAARFLREWFDAPGLRVLFWPAVLGYLRIVTHASMLRVPLHPDAACANIEAMLARPGTRVVGERPRFWNHLHRTITEVGARGKLVPDAHLVALMRQHGVGTIWTRDRDFRKFDGIRVRDPFA